MPCGLHYLELQLNRTSTVCVRECVCMHMYYTIRIYAFASVYIAIQLNSAHGLYF